MHLFLNKLVMGRPLGAVFRSEFWSGFN